MPRCPSVRSLLASTRVQPPYAPQPTRAELLAALQRFANHEATASDADALLQRDESYRLWLARRDALRSAILSHDLKATPQGQRQLKACHCATCGRWRVELRALHEAQGVEEPKP